MADPPRYPVTDDDNGVEPDDGSAGGTPRWVSHLWIVIGAVLVVVLIVLHLTGTIGPGAH